MKTYKFLIAGLITYGSFAALMVSTFFRTSEATFDFSNMAQLKPILIMVVSSAGLGMLIGQIFMKLMKTLPFNNLYLKSGVFHLCVILLIFIKKITSGGLNIELLFIVVVGFLTGLMYMWALRLIYPEFMDQYKKEINSSSL